MPPQRMQLEGPSLEALLGQVRREHGDAARIVQAEKVRTGGVGGFFARERYQLDLEVDEDAAPMSLLDLAERVNEVQGLDVTTRLPGPSISTENSSFADVLSRLQAETEPAPKDPPAGVDEQPLLGWLQSLPTVPMPSYAPGQVLAVVGEPERALRTAAVLAGELGVDPQSVFLATPSERSRVAARRTLSDPADMGVRRARWARQPHSTIVAIDAPMALRPEGWARSALAALAPAFVYGAVSASTKVADVGEWARRLGQVDALSVDGVDATLDPASILTAGIPVALLEGRPATPGLWSAILSERRGT